MKFTKLTGEVANVSKLPDTPTLENGYTPRVLKETFDRAGEDIKEYINEVLLTELEGGECAGKLGMSPCETLVSRSVQSGLEELARQISEISNAQIPEGTVTPDKFIPSVAGFITEGSPRHAFFSEHGTHTFTPTRTGNYKISVQGAGGGGGCVGMQRISFGGCSGAATVGWLRLEAGREYTVVVGRGGEGLLAGETGALLSRAQKGEGSGFYDGETELLFAGGGGVEGYPDSPPGTRGGTLAFRGATAVYRYLIASESDSWEIGAPSLFASETAYRTFPAGPGAGGYGAKYDFTASSYSYGGGNGGDGGVLIEWME